MRTLSRRRLVLTLPNDCTQKLEQSKNVLNQPQKIHTIQTRELCLVSFLSPHPDWLETNGLHR